MNAFERRVLSALFALLVVLSLTAFYLHHRQSVRLEVIRPEAKDAR